MARMPACRGREKSVSGVRLTTPRLVAKTRKWSSLNSRTGTTAWILSPGWIWIRFTSGWPLAARAALGMRCTFSQ